MKRGDRATIIKGYGGFNSRARLIRTYEPEERKKLFPFMRRGAQGPDPCFKSCSIIILIFSGISSQTMIS